MPKMKSRNSVKKRFSLTGTGKLKFKKSHGRHILTKKTTKRKRQLRRSATLYAPFAKRLKKLIQE